MYLQIMLNKSLTWAPLWCNYAEVLCVYAQQSKVVPVL